MIYLCKHFVPTGQPCASCELERPRTYTQADLDRAVLEARIAEANKILSMLIPRGDVWMMIKGRIADLETQLRKAGGGA